MSAVKDLTGQRFGRLVVVERGGRDKNGLTTWKCRCDCGETTIETRSNLINGRVNSCGCLSIELSLQRFTKHGKRHTRLYGVWNNMKNRCYNPKVHNYHRYGARGITVCEEWRDNFEKFCEWAISNGYDENAPFGKCTLDRIDNDKGYSPDNCRWVDAKTQSNNRSNNRKEIHK